MSATDTRCCPAARAWATVTARCSWPNRSLSKAEVAGKKIAVPGTMTSAFLALQLWLGKSAKEFNYVVVPFDQIFKTIRSGQADAGLIIHEGQLTYRNEGLVVCEDFGVWWGKQNNGLPLPLGGNVIHKKFSPEVRKTICREFYPRASNSASTIALRRCNTHCSTRATWAATSPTSSSGCTSIIGRWIMVSGGGNPFAGSWEELLKAG